MEKTYISQLFVEENTTVTTDIEPAISIDHTNRLTVGIQSLQRALGITQMRPMDAGKSVKLYKVVKENTPEQVAEGETIPLTKITRKKVGEIVMKLKKYRKQTTAEAIQEDGYENSINATDEKLLAEVRKDIKTDFFTTIKGGSGTAEAGDTLQAACANLWGALQVYYEDMDVVPIFFIHPTDVADYLGGAQITTQNAFGISYIQDFLGMGNAFITTGVEAKHPEATVTQNLHGVYVPAGGAVGQAFGLTYDSTGLVGMKHYTADSEASLDTLIMTGVKFYAEDATGVFKGTIGE